MAHAVGDTHEFAIYGAHLLVTFPILDADGDPVTGASGLDSEVSTDLGTFTDCTNEATELATNSGIYYLYLTGAELTGSIATVRVQTSTSGAKTTPLSIPIVRLPILASGTAQAGGSSTITLAAGTSKVDNDLAGLFVRITNNSPSGAQYQARRIISNVASTQVATVDAAWGTNPSSASTYDLLAPTTANVSSWAGTLPPAIATAGYPDVNAKFHGGTSQTGRDIGASVLLSSGSGTGQLDFTSGVVKANVTQFGGSNGTFSGGRPEVNATHFAGTISAGAAGYVGLDWGHITAPTTTVALTGTTIATTQKVDLETIKTNAVVNGGTVTFPTNATLASTTNIAAGTITTVTTVTNQLTAAQIATGVWTDTVAGDFTTALSVGKSVMNGVSLGTGLTVAAVSGAVGSVTGSVGSIASGGITAVSFAADAITAAKIADGAIDTATFAAGTTIPRCTLVDTLTTYTGNTPQTGDSFARMGATGSGLTSLAPSATALSTAQWTGARAAYLDNINNANLTSVPAFPGNFAALGINASGHVSRVTLADTTTTNTDMLTAAGVWAAGTRTLTAGTNIQLPSNGLANVTAWTVTIAGSLSGSVGSVSGGVTLADAAITDAKFSFTADPSAAPTGVVGMVVWIAARLGLRRVVNSLSAKTIKVKRADGSTDWTTNTYTSSATSENVGPAA